MTDNKASTPVEPCTHDPRFSGVFFAKNGCVACELEYVVACNRVLYIETHKQIVGLLDKITKAFVDEAKRETNPRKKTVLTISAAIADEIADSLSQELIKGIGKQALDGPAVLLPTRIEDLPVLDHGSTFNAHTEMLGVLSEVEGKSAADTTTNPSYRLAVSTVVHAVRQHILGRIKQTDPPRKETPCPESPPVTENTSKPSTPQSNTASSPEAGV